MTYTPNFENKAFRRRAMLALKFVSRVSYKLHQPSWLSCRWIHHKDNLGKSGNPVSDYLKDLLLICVDERYEYKGDKKSCKKYIKNRKGIEFLKQQLGTNTQSKSRLLTDEIKSQLESGNFTYSDKGSRLYTPLQSFPKFQKHQLLSTNSYRYEYDIECCAATLIFQFARKCGMDLYLTALQEYIRNRTQIRQTLARDCEVNESHIKSLINILLFGGVIQYNPQHPNEIYYLFEGDKARIEYIKQHAFINQLKADIRTCWFYIKPHMSRRTCVDKRGIEKSIPINNKRKAGLYRDLERSILDVIRCHLERTNNKYLLEHDGFTCVNEIDRDQLINEIYLKTSFEIKLDMNILGSSLS